MWISVISDAKDVGDMVVRVNLLKNKIFLYFLFSPALSIVEFENIFLDDKCFGFKITNLKAECLILSCVKLHCVMFGKYWVSCTIIKSVENV